MKTEEKIKSLINKTILRMHHDSDYLYLELENSPRVKFTAYGDCCSESWIESCESPTKPEKIISFREVEIPPTLEATAEEHDKHECLQQYFYKLTTDNGSYLVEMRNSSNGCYGGSLE